MSVGGCDILVVSAATTAGWRTSARELMGGLERCGVSARLVETGPLPRVRTFALTDLGEAVAARRTAAREPGCAAVIYCAITTALLWPRPGAIWVDALAAENRPGRHGVWQRALEQRRLRQAPVVLAMSPGALTGAPGDVRSVVLPVPVEPSDPSAWSIVPTPRAQSTTHSPQRDIAALTYAGNPEKKRLDAVLGGWERARREGETLVVAGADGPERPGVHYAGRLPREEYRSLVRRARAFIAAPRREDYGTAQLEALADGCLLVTAPAPGAYPALELARRLDPRLVDEDLRRAIRTALDDPLPGYAERAAELLEPSRRAAFDRTLREQVLPRLV